MNSIDQHTEQPHRLLGRVRNLLITNLMGGGGKLLALISYSVLLLCSACSPQPKEHICGVPVQGSPWQLAAAIHDSGDQTFIVESVDLITETKAYISGWQMPQEVPAQIICDLTPSGEVTAAVLNCETLNND